MSGASIWNPQGGIASTANANNSYLSQAYVATQGQVLFNISAFTYQPGTGSLDVYIDGAYQFITKDFVETTATSVTLVTPVSAGADVVVRGLIGSTNATSAAASAAAALVSANNAAVSETNAGLSAIASAGSAAAAATSLAAVNNTIAAAFVSTSATSRLIGTGATTFVTDTNGSFKVGQWLTITSRANSANQEFGQVTSYAFPNLGINITQIYGSGTFADWNISMSGAQGPQGIQGIQGPVGTGITPQTNGFTLTGGSPTPQTLTADISVSLSALALKTSVPTGATTTNPMTANLVLVAASNQVQRVSPNIAGLSIQLPDCTTLAVNVADRFELANEVTTKPFPVSILDSTGTLRGWLRAGDRVMVDIVDITSAGGFILRSTDLDGNRGIGFYGMPALLGTTSGISGGPTAGYSCMYEDSEYGVLVFDSATTTYMQAFQVTESGTYLGGTVTDLGTQLAGAPELVSNIQMTALSSSQIVLAYADAGTISKCVIIGTSGTNLNISFGAPVVSGYAQSNSCPPAKLTSTSFIWATMSGGTTAQVAVATIAGSVITFGAFVQLSTGVSPTPMSVIALSATLAHFVLAGRYAMRVSIAGTVPTPGTRVDMGASLLNFNNAYNQNYISRINATQSLAIAGDTNKTPALFATVITDANPTVTITQTNLVVNPSGVSVTSPLVSLMATPVGCVPIGNGSLLITFKQSQITAATGNLASGASYGFATIKMVGTTPVLGPIVKYPLSGSAMALSLNNQNIPVGAITKGRGLLGRFSASSNAGGGTVYTVIEFQPILVT